MPLPWCSMPFERPGRAVGVAAIALPHLAAAGRLALGAGFPGRLPQLSLPHRLRYSVHARAPEPLDRTEPIAAQPPCAEHHLREIYASPNRQYHTDAEAAELA